MIDGLTMQKMNDLLLDDIDDIFELAECCVQRIAGRAAIDPVMHVQYSVVLSVLIDREIDTSEQPNFYNIWALIVRDNVDEELKDDRNFEMLAKMIQPEVLQKLLVDLGLWLQPFQLMRPSTAA